MPDSSNPINVFLGVVFIFFGIIILPIGLTGVFSDTGEIKYVFYMLSFASLLLIYGGIQTLLKQKKNLAAKNADLKMFNELKKGKDLKGKQTGSGNIVLGKWTFGSSEYKTVAVKEIKESKTEAFKMAGIVLVLGTLILPNVRPVSYLLAFVISAVMAGIVFVIKLSMGRASWRSGNKESGDVIITNNSIFLNGQYHFLNNDQFTLESVKFNEDNKLLIFEVSWFTRTGRIYDDIRVPFPESALDEARRVYYHFQRP
jgi:hypothetical protein